ncbi:hypothetical protein BV378_37390 [Nostoc sp. RF31YmG]|nr:hypothetical protein BV378_37390 [Nostoc sp. RF31YmG]
MLGFTEFKRYFTQVGKPAHVSGSPTYASVSFFPGIGIRFKGKPPVHFSTMFVILFSAAISKSEQF